MTAVSGSQFTLNVQSNEAGKAYYYVVADASPTPPTPAQLEAQYASAYGTVTIFAKGEITLTAADTAYDVNVTGLSENTAYSVFVVAEDDQAAPNLQTPVTDLDVTTADDTPPSFASGFPKATEIKDTEFKLVVELDEPGLFHWAVLPSGDTAPTAAEMAASNNADAVAEIRRRGVAVTAGSLQKTVTVATGLAEATQYDVYVLARDDNGDLGGGQSDKRPGLGRVLRAGWPTADVTPPAFESTFPSIPSASITTSALNISVQLDEPGTVYYYLVEEEDTPPTAAQVTGQTATYGATTVVAKGTVVVTAASVAADAAITGLDDLTAYSAYVVAADDGMTSTATNAYYSTAPNVATSATRVNATTADGTPPVFVGAYTPATVEIDGTAFDIDVQLDEPGTVYYIVVTRTSEDPPATPPTSARAKTGDFAGTVACGNFAVAERGDQRHRVGGGGDGSHDYRVRRPRQRPDPRLGRERRVQRVPPDRVREAVLGVPRGRGRRDGPQHASRAAPPERHHDGRHRAYVPQRVCGDGGGVRLGKLGGDVRVPPEPWGRRAAGDDVAGRAGHGVLPRGAEHGRRAHQRRGQGVRRVARRRRAGRRGVRVHALRRLGDFAFGVRAPAFFAAQTETAYALKGLPSETAVKVYVVAEDFEDQRLPHAGLKTNPPVSNFQANVSHVDATTADITPPRSRRWRRRRTRAWRSRNSGDVTHDKASLEFALDEPGVVHYVVLLRDQTYHAGYTDGTERQTPSAAEIRAGTGPGGVSAADAASVNVTAADTVVAVNTTAAALAAGTKYDVYVVAEDDFSPRTARATGKVVKLQFSTRDNVAPSFVSGFPSAATGGVGVEMTVELNEPGKAYFVVVARDADAPTADEVVAGVDYGSVTVVAKCAAFDVLAASTPTACSAAGLTEATEYDVYVAVDDVVDVALDGGHPYPSANRVLDPGAPVQITTADTTPRVRRFIARGDRARLGRHVPGLHRERERGGHGVVRGGPADRRRPSSLNVRKGVSATGGAVAAAGYAAISAGDVDSDVTVAVANQRLASETAYYLHVAAEDASSPPSLGASASRVAFVTPDVTAAALRGAVHQFRRDQRGGRRRPST